MDNSKVDDEGHGSDVLDDVSGGGQSSLQDGEVAKDFFLSESEVTTESNVEGEEGADAESRASIVGDRLDDESGQAVHKDPGVSDISEEPAIAREGKEGDEEADDFARRGVAFSKEKATALKNFVKERGIVVSKVIRRLSGKRDDFEKGMAEEPVNEEAKESTETVDKKPWFSFLKLMAESEEVPSSRSDNENLGPRVEGRITIYTRSGCPDSRRVRSLLRQKGLKFVEINLDVFPRRRIELEERTGKTSVPQLFFNENLIGGLDELVELDKRGKLDGKIKEVVENKAPGSAPLPPVYGEDDPQDKALDEFAETVVKLRERIHVKDRFIKYRLFNRCFVGSEAVDFLVEDQKLSRIEAVDYGRKLAAKHFFHHVLQEHLFEDGNNFYRFLEHDPVVSTKCYNFLGITNDLEPHPAHEVGKELMELILAIYETHVSEDGKHVNYRGISRSEEFRRYAKMTEELQRIDLQILTREEKLALFINLFNSMVIHATILLGDPSGAIERMRLFWDFQYVIGGYPYSLSAIQNGILRANQRSPYTLTKPFGLKDPRLQVCLVEPDPLIHFAISYGTKSSPVLRCYTAEAVDAELRFAARAFFEEGGISVTPATKTVLLSKILKWYSVDFGKSEEEVLLWVTHHLDPKNAEELLNLLSSMDVLNITYQPYDWAINI
ncbi:hypothetical protein O6H91_09G056300 [Diphasiastrum complanatum]|uniref:Uncharacterized protein n=4 Tax=Diphasiastrum complanatum TaxID=34168 RepID=A0ACC2CPH9_DIPCM|nr:hypothetical protein O6H91_09G056300 [Diphasiastrum complanatum]KAJ7543862.1 hypothetical protein O6H91_09G056300 [Diphasiastrum complanatum]KAJ7543863.1 hypothetical protein O6H91_09G056300 [Diphasiastrum complanatum]KAJ7543864.1 hypothetical protein O6H91_09G056300 [Diphasiastrum complanatum]